MPENKWFNKNFDQKKLLLELFNHNQFLQAQVNALMDMLYHVMVDGMDEQPEGIKKLAEELCRKHTEQLLGEDAMGMYSERWADILKANMDDIGGVSFGAENPT